MSFELPAIDVSNTSSGAGSPFRRSVRAASTGNVNLTTNLFNTSLDGVTLGTDFRILLKDQTTASENGIYIVVNGVGLSYRAEDYNTGTGAAATMMYVQQGTINADTGWLCTNDTGTDIIGTNNLTYRQFAGTGVDGNVNGPGTVVDNQLVRWDGTTGMAIQSSTVALDDTGNLSGLGYIQLSDITAPGNPSNGQSRIYKKTGNAGLFYIADSAGTEIDLTIPGTASNIGATGVGVYDSYLNRDFRFKKLVAGSTKLSITDPGVNQSLALDVVPANIDHNGLLNYSANRHIDHSTVSISAGSGLTGGGTIAATRTLSLNINGLTEDTAPAQNDFVPTYDTSAAGNRKVSLLNLTKIRNYYDAIVDSNGTADFTTINAAFTAGHKTLFVRDGTYTETANIVMPDGGQLVGESTKNVIINLGTFSLRADGNAGTFQATGTVSINYNTNTVTGAGTTFTALNAVGTNTYIILGQNAYLVSSVTNDTQLVISSVFKGKTLASVSYRAMKMLSSNIVRDITINSSTTTGVYFRAVKGGDIRNVVVQGCVNGFELNDCCDVILSTCRSINNSGEGFLLNNTTACSLVQSQAFNCTLNGISLTNINKNLIMDSIESCNNGLDGIDMAGTAANTQITAAILNGNFVNGCEVGATITSTVFEGCAASFNGQDGISSTGVNIIIGSCDLSTNTRFGVKTGNNTTISDCQIYSNGSHGVDLGNNSKCSVVSNYIFSNTGYGINLTNIDITISGNNIISNSVGIYMAGADRCSLTGNNIISNTNQGIYISGSAILNTIVGNMLKYNNVGIQTVSGSADNIFSDNLLGWHTSHGMTLVGNTSIINGNRAVNNGGNGIRIESGSTDVTYFNNNTQGNTGAGFVDAGTITSNYEPELVNRLDARSATTLQLGFNTATKVELAKAGVTTETKGPVNALNYFQLNDITAPANPTNGQGRLYKKTGDDGIFWKPDSAGVEIDLTDGNVNTSANLTANAITVGDNGVRHIKSSNWSIVNDKMSVSTSQTGFLLDIHNTLATGGGNGFRVRAGENAGDIAFSVLDQDETFPIMELEANDGYITMGRTFAQTLTDNGVVYGFDNQHTAAPAAHCDFNTKNGLYRINGVPVPNVAQTLTNKTIIDNTNNVATNSLKTTGAVVDVAAAAPPTTGQFLRATGATTATWQGLVVRLPHTWAIPGAIAVASGSTNYIVPWFVTAYSGQTVRIARARYVIQSGTSANVKVQINGVDATGFTNLTVNTTAATTDPTDVTVADGDRIALIVNSITGAPMNMTFTLTVEYVY